MSVGTRRGSLAAPLLTLLLAAVVAPVPREALAQDACTIEGTERSDLLTGTPGPDVICGLGGDDHLVGAGGDDILQGGDGEDLLEAGDGADTLSGGAGVDLLFGGAGDDALHGDEDMDYLDGGLGADQLDGGPAPDTCPVGVGDTQLSCTRASPNDPNDAGGAADVSRMVVGFVTNEPTWTFQTFANFTIKDIRDHAYFLVWLDTGGDPAAELYGMLRSNGTKILGELYRPNGDFIANVDGSKPAANSVRIRIPRSRLQLDRGRKFVRWYGQTLYTGTACPSTCFDRIPNADWLLRALL